MIYQIGDVFLFPNVFENKIYIKVGDMEGSIISRYKQNVLCTTNNRRLINEKWLHESFPVVDATALSCLGDGSSTFASIVDRWPIWQQVVGRQTGDGHEEQTK